jgi:hypothetical protein
MIAASYDRRTAMRSPYLAKASRARVAIDVAVKLLTVALLVWAIANPELAQFQGKAFVGRAVAYPIALAIVPVAWWFRGRRRIPYPVDSDILFGLPFLIDVAGNALNLYDAIEWWDDANHLVNWALHTAAAGLLLRYGLWGAATRAALGTGWAAVTALLWEFAEYVTFVPGSAEAATAYSDTLGDLALGLTGGLVASILTARLPRLRANRDPDWR